MFAEYLAVALTGLFICGFLVYLYSFILKWRAARQQKQIQARERALRVVTIHNVAYNCDPISSNDSRLESSVSIFPDSGGIAHIRSVYDAPPPSYEEAMRVQQLSSNTSHTITTNPTPASGAPT